MLARALAKPSNLLVLDEPTNDLDLETLDVLEEMLGDYEGTVILISHDRDFLDRVVTSVIVPEGDGRWIEYAGGYTDMLAQRGADLTREAAEGRGGRAETREAESRARRRATSKRRLNFNEKHALETLPKTIAKLQAEIAEPAAPSSTIPASTPATARPSTPPPPRWPTAQAELAEAEEKWLRAGNAARGDRGGMSAATSIRHSGACAFGREPGLQKPARCVCLDSGFAPSVRPGMTGPGGSV